MGKLDLGGAAAGAASGGATGFSIGGPVGGAIGGVAGGLLGLFGGGRKRPKKISTLDKNQKALYGEYSKGLNGQGGKFGNLFNFDSQGATENWKQNYADPAYQNYNENIVPKITGQFRGGNLQNSSYLAGALGKAGSDVQKNLNAHMSNMLYNGQQDALQRRVQGIDKLLNMQTFAYQQPQQSASQQGFGALLSAGGKAFGSYVDNKFSPKPGANVPVGGG